jgi:hypothetical protein
LQRDPTPPSVTVCVTIATTWDDDTRAQTPRVSRGDSRDASKNTCHETSDPPAACPRGHSAAGESGRRRFDRLPGRIRTPVAGVLLALGFFWALPGAVTDIPAGYGSLVSDGKVWQLGAHPPYGH